MNVCAVIVLSTLIVWETVRFLFASRLFGLRKEYDAQRDEIARRFYIRLHPLFTLVAMMDFVGFSACVVGVFSECCYLFVLVLLLSASQLQKMGVECLRMDAAVTVVLYVAALYGLCFN